jgi:hypothetical protein
LKFLNILLLIPRKLRVGRCSDVKFKENAVVFISREVPVALKKLNSVKPVVTPALTHLELRGEFTNDFLVGLVPLAYHFDAVFILLSGFRSIASRT